MTAPEMVCPGCKSSEVTGDSWEMCAEAAQSWQDVSCHDCASTWTDVFRFSHRENVERGTGEAVPPVADDFGGKYWHNCDGCGRLLFSDDSCGCRHEIPADDQAPSWVFHNLDTGTVEEVTPGAYFVAVDGLAHEDRQILEDSELAGWHGFGLSEVISRVGAPVSDVLAVWSAVQAAGVSLSELVALLSSRGVGA